MHNDPATAASVAGPSALAVAAAGLVALAVAMGIGRFAFTPIMPMMEADAGLTLRAAGWLAAANYLGYLVGALCAARVGRTWAMRGGLLITAVVTFAMGVADDFALQLVLRFIAGVASAWVLVHVSAWALARLLVLRRTRSNGVVFAGVGIGIAGAGLISMALMAARIDSRGTWEIFGVLSLVLTIACWKALRGEGSSSTAPAPPARGPVRLRWNADRVRLAVCYGAFGFGYIIPATYLPNMAHAYIPDPFVFGWAWPVFGTAAALSTWASSRWLPRFDNRRLLALAYVAMAVGNLLPAVLGGLAPILIAALLVGGTFMICTMAGLAEARVIGGAQATALIAAVTASFALMQVVGPVVVSAVAHLRGGFVGALLAATAVLLLAAAWLWHSARDGLPTREVSA
ncbi:MAG TPA: YbfB/YjiJ family MFS transporter [Rhodanobacteraceae bacterium]|nr:YbfB/YjiJ family MFS transporter [Rhodanobacteraceae bacterium]